MVLADPVKKILRFFILDVIRLRRRAPCWRYALSRHLIKRLAGGVTIA